MWQLTINDIIACNSYNNVIGHIIVVEMNKKKKKRKDGESRVK